MPWIVLGYAIYSLCSAHETQAPNQLDLLLGINTSLRGTVTCWNDIVIAYHMHHWLYLTIIWALCPIDEMREVCLGGIIQGIQYTDWYKVISVSSS